MKTKEPVTKPAKKLQIHPVYVQQMMQSATVRVAQKAWRRECSGQAQ